MIIELIGGPRDGQRINVADSAMQIRIMLTDFRIIYWPRHLDHRCRTGTYERDVYRPDHFNWKGEN